MLFRSVPPRRRLEVEVEARQENKASEEEREAFGAKKGGREDQGESNQAEERGETQAKDDDEKDRETQDQAVAPAGYSHSIVPGGLLVVDPRLI